MSINGRLIKTTNSDRVVVVSGNKEILVSHIDVYKEALRDVNRYIEFEVELEVIEEGYYFHYGIIVPPNLFENAD